MLSLVNVGTAIRQARHCNGCGFLLGPAYPSGTCPTCREKDIRSISNAAITQRDAPAASEMRTISLMARCISCSVTVNQLSAPGDGRLCAQCYARISSQNILGPPASGSMSDRSRRAPNVLRLTDPRPSIPYFNAQGQLIVPSERQFPLPSPAVSQARHSRSASKPRPLGPSGHENTCIRPRCSNKLPQHITGRVCRRCLVAEQAAQDRSFVSVQRISYPRQAPTLVHSWAPPVLPQAQNSNLKSKNDSIMGSPATVEPHTQAVTALKDTELDDELDLMYPEETMAVDQSTNSHEVPSGKQLSGNDKMVAPERPAAVALRGEASSQVDNDATRAHLSLARPLKVDAPYIQATTLPHVSISVTPIRICETEGCSKIVALESKWPRCSSCSLKRWKARLKDNVTEEDCTISPVTAQSTDLQARKRRKTTGIKDVCEAFNAIANAQDHPIPKTNRTETPSEKGSSSATMLTKVDVPPSNFNVSVTTSISLTEPSGSLAAINTSQTDSCAVLETERAPSIVSIIPSGECPSAQLSAEMQMEKKVQASGSRVSPLSCSQAESSTSGHRPDVHFGYPENVFEDAPHKTGLTGWDSDLSDLTSSEDSGESEKDDDDDDEDDAEQHHQPSGLKIRIPALASLQSFDLGRVCTVKSCRSPVSDNSQYKLCDKCRNRSREYQRKRFFPSIGRDTIGSSSIHNEAISANDAMVQAPTHSSAMAVNAPDIRPSDNGVKETFPTQPVTEPPPGWRICAIISCKVHIPPLEEYRWKLCESCRRRARLRARAHKYRLQSEANSPGNVDNKQYRPCSVRSCNIPVHWSSPFEECEECRARGSKPNEIAILLNGQAPSQSTPLALSSKTNKKKHRHVSKKVQRYIQYQHAGKLVRTFKSHLENFARARMYYEFYKAQKATSPSESNVFSFDGEYSVVADLSLKAGQRELYLDNIRNDITTSIQIRFIPTGAYFVADGGIIKRFECRHEFVLPIPTSTSTKHESSQAAEVCYTTRMLGELELSLLEDNSHRFWPGYRIIVRFRLVG